MALRTGLAQLLRRMHPAFVRPGLDQVTPVCQRNLSLVNIFDEQKNHLIKPKTDLDYFKVFGLDPGYDLDVRDLAKVFRQAQTILHPDKHSTKAQDQLELSEEWSSLVNSAYQTLKDPLNRALYLLEMKGRPLEEGDVATDATFLAEVMEANEEVADAESSADICALSEHNKKVIKDYEEEVSKAFGANDIDLARDLVSKMKYFCSLQDKIKERELELEGKDV